MLLALASMASLASFFYFFRHKEILLYGDAVAHINIARRVFDSRTPGFQQLGTVWLPLPHLLMMPLVVSDWMWRTGVGGSVVSMLAYVMGALGIARLFWKQTILARSTPGTESSLRQGGWVAALFYLFNPNLMYLQTTAMTEALSIAMSIWAIVFYAEFQQASERAGSGAADEAQAIASAVRALRNCALALAVGMLTRYDAWFLAACIAVLVILGRYRIRPRLSAEQNTKLSRAVKHFMALVALVPVLWFAHNFGTYGNPLEFANGPYSARAIAQRSAQSGMTHPGYHNLRVALLYFFKCAKLNLCDGRMVVAALVAMVGGTLMLIRWRRKALAFLLWSPLVFYSLSIAYGGVPIFMPVWWPFSFYNVRYGLQLLPMFAVTAGAAAALIWRMPRLHRVTSTALMLLLAGIYGAGWRQGPITLREARVNAVTRVALETRLADLLQRLPANASLLMYTGDHVGALEQAGVRLKRVTTENNYHLWQNALEHPAQSAEYVVAMTGDPVSEAVQRHGEGLQLVEAFYVPGQPAAAIYKSAAP